jgi:hypothetical protein
MPERVARYRISFLRLGVFLMIRAVVSLTFLLGFMPSVNASPRDHGSMCVARVLESEELAYAPMGYWLVR